MTELDAFSARLAPVKYLFERKGLVRVSIGKAENESVAALVENAIEITLPFIDDFSQNSESGDMVELEVRRLFSLQVSVLKIPLVPVYLPTRKFGKSDLCTHVTARTR